MEVCVISIGNELLSGKTVNTNASWLGARLYSIGLFNREVITIRDEPAQIQGAIERAVTGYDVVIVTGGLGPTHDDITKSILADFFESELVLDEAILNKIQDRFARRGVEMPEINREQALVPDKARAVNNPIGTAPGIHFEHDGKHLFALPGVPGEMKAMIEADILPLLQDLAGTKVTTQVFRTTGISESGLFEQTAELVARFPQLEVAFLPKATDVDIRVLDRHDDAQQLHAFGAELKRILGEFIYADSDTDIAEIIGEQLKKQGQMLAVAESFTGGLIQDRLTDIPGSSEYFAGGFITYSNESKVSQLGVSESSLANFGAVSEQVAAEMAEGARKILGADIAISTTGIAGPGGATATKEVGLCYFAVATAKETHTAKHVLGKHRLRNKLRGSQIALDMLRRHLSE